MKYNKEKVMNSIYSACYEYLGIVFTNSREENQEKFSKELSTALNAAYKAGEENGLRKGQKILEHFYKPEALK